MDGLLEYLDEATTPAVSAKRIPSDRYLNIGDNGWPDVLFPGNTASMQDVEVLRGAGPPDRRKPVFPQPLAGRLPDPGIRRGGAAGALDEARVIADEARG